MKKQMIRWLLCLLAAPLTAASLNVPQASAEETALPATPWPGEETVTVYDTEPVFYGNASGLDFHNGRLYAVDNGGGFLWVLEAFPDGSLHPADGYEIGREVQYADRDSLRGPDPEGITVDGDGLVYLAVERDHDMPWQTQNVILQLDPWDPSNPIKAMQQWDLTASLPYAPANKGIEAVEWVSADSVCGRITDCNTGLPLDMDKYPDACSDGLFFLALEANDQIYGYVLNSDGSAVQIARLDPGLRGISALEYDPAEGALWVTADDRGGNEAAKLLLSDPAAQWQRILPPVGLDPRQNTEGFAIAEEIFTRDDRRPVYRLRDGVHDGALTVGFMHWHVHQFPEEWVTDSYRHWHVCRCGETADAEEHTFVHMLTEAAQAAAQQDHMAAYHPLCRLCGYVDTGRTFCVGQDLYPELSDTPVIPQLYGIPCI